MKLSADFPGDVPVYPRAKVLAQMTMGAGNQQVTFEADDSTKDVYEYYAKQLPKNGWEIVQDVKMAPTFSLMERRGSDRRWWRSAMVATRAPSRCPSSGSRAERPPGRAAIIIPWESLPLPGFPFCGSLPACN